MENVMANIRKVMSKILSVASAVLLSFMRSSVNRKDLVFSEVDNGTIHTLCIRQSGGIHRGTC